MKYFFLKYGKGENIIKISFGSLDFCPTAVFFQNLVNGYRSIFPQPESGRPIGQIIRITWKGEVKNDRFPECELLKAETG